MTERRPGERPAHVKAARRTSRRARRCPSPKASHDDGSRDRLDPTRYGDWEKKGIAIDF